MGMPRDISVLQPRLDMADFLSKTESTWGHSNPMNRVRVKICGITCEEDARAAIAAGADALGFNTWVGSKRFLDLKNAAGWISELPAFVCRVALCVNASEDEVKQVAALPFIDLLQFHGDESRESCRKFAKSGKAFVRAVRVGADKDLEGLDQWGTQNVLLDAAVSGSYGGTGALLDCELAVRARERYPMLSLTLAGGLDPENVGSVVGRLRPFAVDVASGVESAPGRKDFGKMRAFVGAAHASFCVRTSGK